MAVTFGGFLSNVLHFELRISLLQMWSVVCFHDIGLLKPACASGSQG